MTHKIKDYHVHTEFSDDSNHKMEDVVLDAIAFGIDELCFTDHIDYGVKSEFGDPHAKVIHGEAFVNVDYPSFFKEFDRLSQKYEGQITLKKGFEFGVQMHTITDYESLFKRYELDFVILSIHQVENKEFWTYEFQENRLQEEYNLRYYQELLDVVRNYKDYSVLGHLDLIRRYDKEGSFPFEKTKDIVTEILKQVIQDGKGIELNTSSFRYGLDDLMPSKHILSLYLELGGSILTIGSDSHKKEHLGMYIEEGKSILKQLGYKQYCSFSKMKPIFHDL